MTEAVYLEVSEKTEAAKKAGRRVSVSGMLKFLGVSRSGYLAWLHHAPSDTEKRREAVKAKIQDIYDDSKQNYGAPKITVELRKTGEVISERTVGTYMHQMGIRAQWSKPWTITTKDSDFSTELQNILDEQFNPDRPNAVWCSDIGELSGLRWKDVDFENGYITIDHAVIYFAGKLNKTNKRIYVSTPKTEAGIRKIPMVSEVRKALDEVKQYQYDNGIFCKSDIDGYTDFIFLNRFGTVYLQQDLDRSLSRIIDAYNDCELHEAALNKREALLLPHFTCHSLRHTFCARFCEHETNLKVIQSVMGHVDIGTTMNIYAEVSEARKKQSMEALAENLKLF